MFQKPQIEFKVVNVIAIESHSTDLSAWFRKSDFPHAKCAFTLPSDFDDDDDERV